MNDEVDLKGDIMEKKLMEQENPADLMEAYGEVLKQESTMEMTEQWKSDHFGCFADDCSAVAILFVFFSFAFFSFLFPLNNFHLHFFFSSV